jgi:phage internal scaffolding protein
MFRKPYPSPTSPGLTFEKPSRTVQSDREGTDLKLLLEKYMDTGVVPVFNVPSVPPIDGDFSDVPDFQTMQDMLVDIQEQFDSMPSKIREKFANNPMNMVQFLQDENNVEEAIALGLMERRKPDVKIPVSVVSDKSASGDSKPPGDSV